MRHACVMRSLHDTLNIDIPAGSRKGSLNLLENHIKRGLDNILLVYQSFTKVCARFRANRKTFVNHIHPDFLSSKSKILLT